MLKTLFICQANVGRSQVAMELYRRRGGVADSAGTKVDAPGATLAERPTAATIVGIMRKDHDIDMIHNVRTQLTPELASRYNRLVVMAEEDTWPGWLKNDSRLLHWRIQDPKGQDNDTTQAIVDEIVQRIATLPIS